MQLSAFSNIEATKHLEFNEFHFSVPLSPEVPYYRLMVKIYSWAINFSRA